MEGFWPCTMKALSSGFNNDANMIIFRDGWRSFSTLFVLVSYDSPALRTPPNLESKGQKSWGTPRPKNVEFRHGHEPPLQDISSTGFYVDVGAEDEGFVHVSEIKEIWGVTTRENQHCFGGFWWSNAYFQQTGGMRQESELCRCVFLFLKLLIGYNDFSVCFFHIKYVNTASLRGKVQGWLTHGNPFCLENFFPASKLRRLTAMSIKRYLLVKRRNATRKAIHGCLCPHGKICRKKLTERLPSPGKIYGGFFHPHHKKVTYILSPSHPSEESRVNKVSEEVRIGQEVSVRVLSAEGKLTLSMKPISFWEEKKTPKKKRRWKSHGWDRCRKWWETSNVFFSEVWLKSVTTSCFNAIHQ